MDQSEYILLVSKWLGEMRLLVILGLIHSNLYLFRRAASEFLCQWGRRAYKLFEFLSLASARIGEIMVSRISLRKEMNHCKGVRLRMENEEMERANLNILSGVLIVLNRWITNHYLLIYK